MVHVLVLKAFPLPDRPRDWQMGVEKYVYYERQVIGDAVVDVPITKVRPAKVPRDPEEYRQELAAWEQKTVAVNIENRVIEEALNASKKLCAALDAIKSTLRTDQVWKLFVNSYGSPERLAVTFGEQTFYVSNNKVVRVPDDVERIAVTKHIMARQFEVSHLNDKIIAQFHRPEPVVIPLVTSVAQVDKLRKLPFAPRELLALVKYFKIFRPEDYKTLISNYKYVSGTLMERDRRRSSATTDKIFDKLKSEVMAMGID